MSRARSSASVTKLRISWSTICAVRSDWTRNSGIAAERRKTLDRSSPSDTGPITHHPGHLVPQLIKRHQVAIVEREAHGVTQRRKATRNDRHFVNRLGMGKQPVDYRVSGLVMGDDLLFVLVHPPVFLFQSGNDPFDRFLEIGIHHRVVTLPRRQQRGFVHHVRQVRSNKTRSSRRKGLQIDVRPELHLAGMNLKDLLAPSFVGTVDQHVAIKPPRSQQRAVENLRAIGGREDNQPGLGVESIHFGEQLIQRLLTFVVTSHHATVAALADRIQLVDEDDAGRLGAGLGEQVADPGCSNADEHLNELGAGEREKRNTRFARHRSSEKRLSRAGRAHQQHTFGNPSAEPAKLFRRLQELDDLAKLLHRLVDPSHILESHPGIGLGLNLRPGLAEAHHALGSLPESSHSSHHQAEEHHGQHQWHQPDPERVSERRSSNCLVIHVLLIQEFHQLVVSRDAVGEPGKRGRLAPGSLLSSWRRDGVLFEKALDPVVGDLNFRELALSQSILEFAVGNAPSANVLKRVAEEQKAQKYQQQITERRTNREAKAGRLRLLVMLPPARVETCRTVSARFHTVQVLYAPANVTTTKMSTSPVRSSRNSADGCQKNGGAELAADRLVLGIQQLFDRPCVGIGKPVLAHLIERNPSMVVNSQMRNGGLWGQKATAKHAKIDVILRILVVEMNRLFLHIHLDFHFLAQFAGQRLLIRFTRLDAATGKLPQQRKRGRPGTLGDQIPPPVVLDHRTDDVNMAAAHKTLT